MDIRKNLIAAFVAAQCVLASSVQAADIVPGSDAAIEARLDALRLINQSQYGALAAPLSQNIDDGKMSIVEVFLESNDIECLDLWLEGLCIWMIISVSITGISVTFEFTPRISHYNPDFVIASYPRIGTSPLIESDLLYDQIQTVISKAMLDLMSDHPVPEQYEQEGQFGGRTAESTASQKSIAMFSEVDVIGHPGNVVTLAASGGNIFGDAAGLVSENIAIVQQVAQQSQSQATNILSELSGNSNNVLPSTAGNVSEWQAILPGNGGDINLWEDQIALPAQLGVAQIINTALGSFDTLTDAIDAVTDPQSTQALQEQATTLLENADQALSDAVANSPAFDELQQTVSTTAQTESVGGIANEAVNIIQGAGINSDAAGQESIGQLTESVAGLSQEELDEFFGGATQSELMDQIGDFATAFGDIDEAISGLSSSGLGFSGGVPGFCPKDTEVLTPHYLSGLNVMSWRYQLPELAYPMSYAFPIPGSQYYVGKFQAGTLPVPNQSDGQPAEWASLIPLPDWSTWGNIYPRSGWIAQPDEVKNRALAGFRAAHVATRPTQPHLYNYAEHKPAPSNLRLWHPSPLTPNDITTGAFQMISPKKSGECTLLQDSAIDAGVITSRDPAMTSESGGYLFNMWRQYQCCNRPRKPGSSVTYIDTVPVRIKIL